MVNVDRMVVVIVTKIQGTGVCACVCVCFLTWLTMDCICGGGNEAVQQSQVLAVHFI